MPSYKQVTGEDMIIYVLTNAFRGPEYESFRMAHAAKIDQLEVDTINLPDHIDHMVNTVNISKVGSRQKGAARTIGGKGSAPKCPDGGKHHRGKCPNKGGEVICARCGWNHPTKDCHAKRDKDGTQLQPAEPSNEAPAKGNKDGKGLSKQLAACR